MHKNHDEATVSWEAVDALQETILEWQTNNFPECREWELVLGVCEEAGELAQCILKMHRKIRLEEFDEARLKDSIGDIIIYLIGVCGARKWQLSEIMSTTAGKVILRKWSS